MFAIRTAHFSSPNVSDICGSKDIQEEGTVGERSVNDLVTAKVVPRTFVRSRNVYWVQTPSRASGVLGTSDLDLAPCGVRRMDSQPAASSEKVSSTRYIVYT